MLFLIYTRNCFNYRGIPGVRWFVPETKNEVADVEAAWKIHTSGVIL
jgi:hypothetical protein